MVATMSSFDNTDSSVTLVSGGNCDSTTVYTITNSYKEEYDEVVYLEEEKELAKTGWHNPRNLPINNKYNNNRIRLQIRNQLQYRMRVDENVL